MREWQYRHDTAGVENEGIERSGRNDIFLGGEQGE